MFTIRYSGLAAVLLFALLPVILPGLADDAAPLETNLLADGTMSDAMSGTEEAADYTIRDGMANGTLNGTSNGTLDRSNASDISATSIPAPFNDNSADNATAEAPEAEDAIVEDALVQGIWSGSIADENIILALNQSGRLIYGHAKSEGDNPWNGAVAGMISEDIISISIASQEGGYPLAMHISASVGEGSMQGDLVQYSSGSGASRGLFTATLINPDISGYTAAEVDTDTTTGEETAASAAFATSAADQDDTSDLGQQDAAQTRGGFNDVLQLAKGINPNIMPPMAAI